MPEDDDYIEHYGDTIYEHAQEYKKNIMNVFKDVKNFDAQLFMVKPDLKYRPIEEVKELAITLLKEEFGELMEAFHKEDPILIAKELADLLYVTTQALNRLYDDPQEIWRRVNQSNLSKFGFDAEIREDGKLLKSASYEPPDLNFIKGKF